MGSEKSVQFPVGQMEAEAPRGRCVSRCLLSAHCGLGSASGPEVRSELRGLLDGLVLGTGQVWQAGAVLPGGVQLFSLGFCDPHPL